MAEIYIGTSGWQYSDWKGIFYPDKLKNVEQLSYYAKEFQTVEINSTFYRDPKSANIENWVNRTDDNFNFTIKANRYYTHLKQLITDEQFAERLDDYVLLLRSFDHRLGSVLFQLPPNLKLHIARLEAFLNLWDSIINEHKLKIDLSVELRNNDWLTSDVLKTLAKHNAALVSVDAPKKWLHSRDITADFAYIRFHGGKNLYRSNYNTTQLSEWAAYIKPISPSLRKIYVYFNNDHNAYAVKNARELKAMFNQ